jgi:endonuclease/exonuclease/phosphatase family metal-dependent hydrolase
VTILFPKAKNYIDPKGPVYTGYFSDNDSKFNGNITVVSYNIAFALNIETAIDEFKENQEIQNADIILLQEMDPSGVEKFAKTLKYNYVYYPATYYTIRKIDFGNAVLSKWPIKEHSKIILPHNDLVFSMGRAAVTGVIDISGNEILACSAHTEFIQTPWRKKDQAAALAKNIDIGYDNIIIGGDFNTFLPYTKNVFDKVFSDSGFVRASGNLGVTARESYLNWFTFELDRIYSKGFNVVGSGILKSATASDHKPVWVGFKLF